MPDFSQEFKLALNHVDKKEWPQAAEVLTKVLKIDPDNIDALHLLGIVAQRVGEYHTSIRLIEQAISHNPSEPRFYNNCGEAYRHIGKLDSAIARFRRALAINPGYAEAHNNLGNAFRQQNKLHQAINCYEKALSLEPGYSEAQWNWSLAQLLLGNYKEGWEKYEYRWAAGQKEARPNFPQPLWDGSDIAARTLLITGEQGFGDALQFIRYAPLIAERRAKVVVQCRQELSRLIETVPGVSMTVTDAALAEFEVYAPIMSLPRIFSTTLENIPANVPYLMPDPGLAEKWKRRVAGEPKKFRIGLVWAGNKYHHNDHNRSWPFEIFSPLASIQEAAFFTLQKDGEAKQIGEQGNSLKLIDFTAELTDFAETAALVVNLDLVISVDTAVAHLAGALAKPVWTLLPFSPDWRWLLDKKDSPWYPTMRLFRQRREGDFSQVIATVASELRALISGSHN